MRHPMPRFIPMTRIVLALLMAGLGFCAVSSMAGATPTAVVAAPGDTMLPAGWELCLLQGLAAPATQANVDNLDEWQAAEGGSTNNSAAYNPFNTRRTTDLTNAPLPETISSNGFPAFSTWLAGCAATVATMLQPNMWPITAALRAGNVAPPGVFLADVDKSQWCAPSADGTPCYANKIIGGTGELAAALLGTSAALSVYTNVKSDVNTYEQAVAASAVDQGALTSRNQELAAAQATVSTAQGKLAAADRALRRFAVDEYVSSGLYVSSSFTNVGHVSPFGPPDANGVVAEQYESITASDLLTRSDAAASAVAAALSGRAAATAALGQANATLASDTSAENLDLARLVNDVATLQTAGACTTVQLTVPAPGAGAPAAATATTTTVPTTTGTTPPATTPPSTVPPTTVASTTSTTTTSTTTPTTTTTSTSTTSTVATLPPTTLPPTTLPPTTVPPTTVPPATTAGAAPATQAPAPASPSGLGALQGCIAVFTPAAAA